MNNKKRNIIIVSVIIIISIISMVSVSILNNKKNMKNFYNEYTSIDNDLLANTQNWLDGCNRIYKIRIDNLALDSSQKIEETDYIKNINDSNVSYKKSIEKLKNLKVPKELKNDYENMIQLYDNNFENRVKVTANLKNNQKLDISNDIVENENKLDSLANSFGEKLEKINEK